MTGYRWALPHPWKQVRLDGSMKDRVREILDEVMSQVEVTVSPDELAQQRIKLEGALLSQLRAAEEQGAIDFYFPAGTMHGVQITASVVVSEVLPDAMAPEGGVGRVLAALLEDEASGPVSTADTVWVRTERTIVREADADLDTTLTGRSVVYTTVAPDDERRWLVVAFSSPGDGDPASDFSDLMVELFDAMMSTWRWETSA